MSLLLLFNQGVSGLPQMPVATGSGDRETLRPLLGDRSLVDLVLDDRPSLAVLIDDRATLAIRFGDRHTVRETVASP